MENSFETRGNLCTELGSPLSSVWLVIERAYKEGYKRFHLQFCRLILQLKTAR